MNQRIAQIARHVLDGNPLGCADAQFLCDVSGQDTYDLFYWANRIRVRFMGEQVRFCAIVAARVGGCSEDCRFCSQSSRYPTAIGGLSKLADQQILESAAHAAEVGADSFGIVNSGRAPTRSELDQWLSPIMRKIAADGQTRACATLGTLTLETARFLYDCGIRRVNHNIETSRRFYPSIVTTHSFDDRLQTLRNAREARLSLCSGGIFGLGEDWSDRIDMMLTLREIGVDVMPINFLNPIPGTPLEHREKLPPMECLKIISLSRFMLPDKDLKVAGGREVCLRDLQSWIFFAGASSTMIGNYLTTYGRSPELDHQMVHDLGLSWQTYGGAVAMADQTPEESGCRSHGLPVVYEREAVGSGGTNCG